jgi:hypothetical protein
MILRVSEIKYLKYYFQNGKVTVNAPDGVFSLMAQHCDHIVDEICHHQPETIDFNSYDLVLLLMEEPGRYSRIISEYSKDKITNFKVFRLNEPLNFEERVGVPRVFHEIFSYDYPNDITLDVCRREIVLSQAELEQGANIIDQYVRSENDKLIIFIFSASTLTKILKMKVVVEMMKYFQSIPNRKLILFDPFDDKEVFLRSLNVDVDQAIILKKLSLRQTFSVMADHRIDLIFGPCTGLMHAASGLYNSFIKRRQRNAVPHLLVYTGLYEREGIQNTLVWWQDSLAKCVVLKKNINGAKEICDIHDLDASEFQFQNNLLPCREYTSQMLQDYLYEHFNFGLPTSQHESV